MIELLRNLCNINGVSGDETTVSDFIIKQIEGFCEYKIDPLGNILIFKKGEKRANKKVMIDAHTDEVGMVVTSADDDGFLKFATVGGINTAVLMFRQVTVNGINGVIGGKPIHLTEKEEAVKLPKKDSLYIDIGASSKEEVLQYVNFGDSIAFVNDFSIEGKKVKSKALDNRIGCAVLIQLIRNNSEYDFYGSFSVQEELGTRGAKTAAFSIEPDCAIVIEATTAADIAGVANEDKVCVLGDGPAVSFMDGGTVYDKAYYNAAINSKIKCQSKAAVAGGNDSASIHLSREGVRTLAISAPCRYIHSASSVADIEDIENTLELTKYMLNGICSGSIE